MFELEILINTLEPSSMGFFESCIAKNGLENTLYVIPMFSTVRGILQVLRNLLYIINARTALFGIACVLLCFLKRECYNCKR